MWKVFSRFSEFFVSGSDDHCSSSSVEAERVRRQEAVGRILGHLAHRMNSPIAAMRLAEERLGLEGSSAPIDRSWQTVRSATDDLTDLGRLLLELAPRPVLEPVRQNLASSIETRCREIGARLGITLPFPRPPDSDPGIWDVAIEPRALEVILAPPLENAVDAVKAVGLDPDPPDAAPIRLGLGLARIDRRFVRRHPAARVGHFVVLSVRDEGDGMSPAVQLRAFDPFFSTRGPHRRGLGLTRMQASVSRHGGFVLLSSCPGSGTNVEIFLPRLSAP